jgi:thiol-disulfide isomerase/thioredoxin
MKWFQSIGLAVVWSSFLLSYSSVAAQESNSAPDKVELKAVNYEQLKAEVLKHRGKVVVVDFWNFSCPPCMKGVAHMVGTYKKHGKDGLVPISVNTDDKKDWEKVVGFLTKNNCTFTNFLFDEKEDFEFFATFRTGAPPAIYIFNRQGKWVFFNEVDQEKIDETILKFLKEAP